MRPARLAALCALCLVAGCAHGRDFYFKRLSDHAKAEYAKYEQFLTDHQKTQFIHLKTDAARDEFLAALHIQERLARYPKFIQNAIWDRRVVVGMDEDAVILSVGPPDRVDRGADADSPTVSRQTWTYDARHLTVHFVDHKVSEVDK